MRVSEAYAARKLFSEVVPCLHQNRACDYYCGEHVAGARRGALRFCYGLSDSSHLSSKEAEVLLADFHGAVTTAGSMRLWFSLREALLCPGTTEHSLCEMMKTVEWLAEWERTYPGQVLLQVMREGKGLHEEDGGLRRSSLFGDSEQ